MWPVSIGGLAFTASSDDELRTWYREGRLQPQHLVFDGKRWIEARHVSILITRKSSGFPIVPLMFMGGVAIVLLLVVGVVLIGAGIVAAVKYPAAQGEVAAPRPATVIQSTPKPVTVVRDSRLDDAQRLALRGEKIYEQLVAKNPRLHATIWGSVGSQPMLAVLVPASTWKQLSDKEKSALALFAIGSIENARQNPAGYLHGPSSAPAFLALNEAVSRACDECWTIMTGIVRKGGGMTLDHSPLQGSSATSFLKSVVGFVPKPADVRVTPLIVADSAAAMDAVIQRDYMNAAGHIWSGVNIYQPTTAGMQLACTVEGGSGTKWVLVTFPNDTREWRERREIRGLFVKKDDAALRSERWTELPAPRSF